MKPLRGHIGIHNSLAFSPDGGRLASAGGNFCLCIWDLADPQEKQILKGHENDAWSVAFAPDGKTLVSGGMDGTVRLWGVSTNSQAQPGFPYKNWIHTVAFSRDSKYVAVLAASDHLILWNVAAKREISTQDFSDSEEGQIEFSPDGKTLCASSGGRARHFELPSLRPISEEPADRLIFVADGSLTILARHGEIVRRDLPSRAETPLGSNTISVVSAALSPDGGTLAIAGEEGKMALWDTRRAGLPTMLGGHTSAVYGVAFSPDGKWLASASWDGKIGLWDVAARTNLTFLRGHSGAAWSVAFSADGRTLASSADDNTIKLWNLASLQEAATFR